MRFMRRLAVGASLVLSATAMPLIVATPAYATAFHCVDYLKRAGYVIGAKIRGACATGAKDDFIRRQACLPKLVFVGVRSDHANNACAYAYP